jgi:hypothetical protein
MQIVTNRTGTTIILAERAMTPPRRRVTGRAARERIGMRKTMMRAPPVTAKVTNEGVGTRTTAMRRRIESDESGERNENDPRTKRREGVY